MASVAIPAWEAITAGSVGAMAPEIWRWYKNKLEIARAARVFSPCVVVVCVFFSLLYMCLGGVVAYYSNPTETWAAFYTGMSIPIIVAAASQKGGAEIMNKELEKEQRKVEMMKIERERELRKGAASYGTPSVPRGAAASQEGDIKRTLDEISEIERWKSIKMSTQDELLGRYTKPRENMGVHKQRRISQPKYITSLYRQFQLFNRALL